MLFVAAVRFDFLEMTHYGILANSRCVVGSARILPPWSGKRADFMTCSSRDFVETQGGVDFFVAGAGKVFGGNW